MKGFKVYLCVVLVLVLLVSTAGCNQNRTSDAVDTKRFDKFSSSAEDYPSGTVCENETYVLLWNESTKQVSFLEKATGAVWSPAPSGTQVVEYDEETGMPIKHNPNTQSALIVNYFDPITLDEKKLLSATDAVISGYVYAKKIKNGIRVTYEFTEFEIAVPVEFTIEKERFLITVHPDQIYDNGENFVTAVSIAPFICGIKNNTDEDWLFIPDGSGTVIFANETDSVGNIGKKSVYGEDAAVKTYYSNSTQAQINFPIFGAKIGNSALLGIIESGDEQASISWNIGSKDVKYSSVYPSFSIRGYDLIKPPSGFNSPLSEVQSFAKFINTTPLKVAYYPLSNEDAGLYGMAHYYREYLLKQGKISKKTGAVSEKIGIKLVGSVKQKAFLLGLPTSKLYSLTSIEDSQSVAESLSKQLNGNVYFDLVGFGTTGLDSGKVAGGYTVASSLGGRSALEKFSKQMSSLKIDWFMDFDLINFSKSGCGFSKKNAAVQPTGQIATVQTYDMVTRMPNNDSSYLLSRDELSRAAEQLAEKADAIGVSGISLDSVSHIKYSDYANINYAVCGSMRKDVSKLIKGLREKGNTFLAGAPNGYAAISSDRIIDAPLYSSSYTFAAYDVPFYEMVLKGTVAMNSTSLNLCADPADALLRCIEAGISPSFTLTANYDNELITSDHSLLYGTSYKGNSDNIEKIYKNISEYMKAVSGAAVSGYKVSGDLRITSFDNGMWVAVNYSEEDRLCEYGTVSKHSWISGRSEVQ